MLKEKIQDPEAVMEFLQTIDFSTLKYRQEKLIAIKKYAMDQLGIQTGDRVMIQNYTPTPGDGWWSNRECLVNGALAKITDIDFNVTHNKWYADIILEKEWSVHEWGAGELRRYYREGESRHIFMFWISQLQKVKDEVKITS